MKFSIEAFLMKFCFKDWNKTPLYIAAEKGNSEIVKLLLSMPDIDINAKSIFITKIIYAISNFVGF